MNSSFDWYSNLSRFLTTEKNFLIAGIGFVIVFAIVRLYQIRDSDGERLPPSFPAKSFFLLSHVFLYCTIVLTCALFPTVLTSVSDLASSSGSALEPFTKQIPLGAVVAVGFLFSLPQVKELERQYAVFLHSAQHRTVDEERLCEHLLVCHFHPSDQERRLNDHYLHQFNLYVTDRDDSLVRLGSVEAWRKVNAILRRLRESENSPQNGLSAADRREVERLEKAHRRKTALAVSIMRILNDLGSDAANATKLARVTELLTSTAHIDRESVSDAENMARTIIESPSYERMSDVGKPLRISEQQMMQYLSQIESYFIVEYTLILQSLSRLAARNVMRAGDLAENRLDDLRRAGFDGLGAVEQVTFDRVIWVILVTWFVTFAMFSLPSLYLGTMPKGFAPIILSIAGTFSLAALLGAIWGSRRSLAERRITPWSSYLAAGSLAIAGFFVIHTIRYLFDRDAAIARIVQAFPDRHITFVDYLFSQAPFALSPFIITVAICRLARIREWPTWPVLDLPARVKDGLTLGMLFLATSATSRFLHKLLGTAYAAGSANPDAVRFYLFQLAFFAIGFFIGLIVVGDVRNIAHSQIVASDYPRRPIPLVARTQPT